MTKEELIEILKIKDIFIDEINKKTRARFRYPIIEKIKSDFSLSIRKICSVLDVSKSGYYEWRKNPIISANYNKKLLVDIEKIFWKHKGLYGADRIMGELISKMGIKRNIKTIRRYMDYLGIQSIIRNPNKRNKRYKRFKKKLYQRRFFHKYK